MFILIQFRIWYEQLLDNKDTCCKLCVSVHLNKWFIFCNCEAYDIERHKTTCVWTILDVAIPDFYVVPVFLSENAKMNLLESKYLNVC